MVEVLIPNSIVNRSLLSDHFNSNSLASVVSDSYDMLVAASVAEQQLILREDVDSHPPSAPTSFLPSESLLERVQEQVQWYFSDDNLRKDAFLMKHIARNKSGFVSLKLVASLRKIKALTKDYGVVAESIRLSKCLELNEDCTKVRRLQPVPSVDYTGIPKSIIITDYPVDNPDIAAIQQEYSRYGEVVRVLVLQPGKAVPLQIKSCKSRFPCIGKDMCILVEYETIEIAKKAVKECKNNWRQTATVHLLSQKQDEETKTVVKRSVKTTPESSRALTTRALLRQSRSPKSGGGYSSDSGYSATTSCSPSPPPVRRFVNEKSSSSTVRLVTVIRTPLGPDGSKGFKLRR